MSTNAKNWTTQNSTRPRGLKQIAQTGAIGTLGPKRGSSAGSGVRASTDNNLVTDQQEKVNKANAGGDSHSRPRGGTKKLVQLTKNDSKGSPGSRQQDNVTHIPN